MKPCNKHAFNHQAGFTLVELMVGLTIGLLATIIIMQVLSVFETQKRATTGTADAQTNGSIALYTIGRELKMAGYPLMPVTNSPLECTTLTIDPLLTGIGGIFPAIITDGGTAAGASDSVTIRYGTTNTGGTPSVITAMGAPAANDATVDTNFGCQVNDVAIITNGATCALTRVTALSASTVPVTTTLQNITNAAVNANLACLGTWNEIVYSVNNGNLERNGVPIIAGVVNIQAQYGVSAVASSNQITQWVDATAATGWDAPTVANRNRIKAIRIAVVARNAQRDPTAATAACSSLTADPPLTGLCTWSATSASPLIASPAPAINLSNDPDWQSYRYRVFETIIPLRNMIWSKDTL